MTFGENYFAALKELDSIFEGWLYQELASLKELTTRQRALKVIVQMSRSLLATMVAESRIRGFMGYSVLARCLWEHHVDFETLLRSEGETAAGQFFAFAEVQSWNRAARAHAARLKHSKESPYAFVVEDDGRRAQLKERLEAHWPERNFEKVNKLGNWNGKDLFSRAAALGSDWEIEYREVYSLFSWSAHPNSAGVVNLQREAIQEFGAFAIGHFFEHIYAMVESFLREMEAWDSNTHRFERLVQILSTDIGGS